MMTKRTANTWGSFVIYTFEKILKTVFDISNESKSIENSLTTTFEPVKVRKRAQRLTWDGEEEHPSPAGQKQPYLEYTKFLCEIIEPHDCKKLRRGVIVGKLVQVSANTKRGTE